MLGSADQLAELLDQLFGLQRFAEEVGGAYVGEAVEIFHRGVAGDDDDGDIGAKLFAQALGEDQAGNIGEVDVDDGGVDGMVADVGEGILAAEEGGGLVAGVGQNERQGADDDGMVVDDQDISGGDGRSREHLRCGLLILRLYALRSHGEEITLSGAHHGRQECLPHQNASGKRAG